MEWELRFLDDITTSSPVKGQDISVKNSLNYICILLNGPLPTFTAQVLFLADLLICVDGGSDRLLSYLHRFRDTYELEEPYETLKNIPAVKNGKAWVVGDCDSVKVSVCSLVTSLAYSCLKPTLGALHGVFFFISVDSARV